MRKLWTDEAWEDYLFWQAQDRKTVMRINGILKDIERNPFSGIGKPEPLKHERQGYWSRRIDEANRIVYKVDNNTLIIVQCGTHYGD